MISTRHATSLALWSLAAAAAVAQIIPTYLNDVSDIAFRSPPSASPTHPTQGIGLYDISYSGNTVVYDSWAQDRLATIDFLPTEAHSYLADLRVGSPPRNGHLNWIGYRATENFPHTVLTRGTILSPQISGNGLWYIVVSGDPAMDRMGAKSTNVPEIWIGRRYDEWPAYIQPTGLGDIRLDSPTWMPRMERLPRADGQDPDGWLFDADIDGSGRYVTFVSQATNYVASDTNDDADVFRYDRVYRRMQRVNTTGIGGQSDSNAFVMTPRMDATGEFVVFVSNATDLGTNPSGQTLIYLKNMRTGAISIVSTNALGFNADGFCGSPRLSPDGKYVVFSSLASNLVPGVNPTGTESYTYIKNLSTGAIECISLDWNGVPMPSTEADVSLDGEWVLFTAVPAGDWQTYAFARHRPTNSVYAASWYDLMPPVHLIEGRFKFPAAAPRISSDGLMWYWTSTNRMMNLYTGEFRLPNTFRTNIFRSAPDPTPPTVEPDTYSTPFETPIQLALESNGIFSNDEFLSGRAPKGRLLTAPTHGALNRSIGDWLTEGADELVYTPAAGFTGTDTFRYEAYDGAFHSAPVLVTIYVRGAGDRDLVSLTLNPVGVVGGNPSTGTVTIDGPAPAGGIAIQLETSNTSFGTVPSAVTVPNGASSATFAVNTFPTATDNNLIVTASRNGIVRKARLTIGPDVFSKVADFTVFPRVGLGGDTRTATVELTLAAPAGGALVALTASNSTVNIPANVTVPEGQFFHTFTFTTNPVSSEANCDITADYNRAVTRRVTVNPGPQVKGTLALYDYIGVVDGLTATAWIRQPGTTTVLQTVPVTLDSNGRFSFSTSLQGTFDVAVKASHWLSAKNASVEIRDRNVELFFNCQNGDANGDNVVNVLDFMVLRIAFGSSPGDPNWNPMADCDGNGQVNALDFVSLRANFGSAGE